MIRANDALRRAATHHPLVTLLVLGGCVRLIATVFSGGYLGTDDHFQVIEIAASWMRGDWVFVDDGVQFYRSLVYPCANYVVMRGLALTGVTHPDTVVLILRLLHGAFSLWAITLTWRYGKLLGGDKCGFTAGAIVALAAVMPYGAVRQLIETVSLPFLLWGLLRTERGLRGEGQYSHLIAGLALGIGIVIRIQIVFAVVGIGLYLLWKKEWRALALTVLGAAIPVAIQGIIDWLMHGTFLGSVWVYLEHNRAHAYSYVVGPWYRYILLVLGIFMPPFSLLFFPAMFRALKKQGVLPWALWTFFIVHSIVPGKQERFMFPVFPELALAGVIGLAAWYESAGEQLRKWIRGGWRYFWIVNTVVLLIAILNYSQKARIESLLYLYDQGSEVTGVVGDYTERGVMLPEYYLYGYRDTISPTIYQAHTVADLDTLRMRASGELDPPIVPPEYVVIFSSGKIDEHLDQLQKHLAPCEVVHYVEPSLADRLLRQFNPKYNHSKEAWVARLMWDDIGIRVE